ncbi:MAG: hypothetical protein HQL06_15125 [Nitrospirae bacterium]|nr:hypothetical protein [Nitrospirota bacterium]
MYVLGWFFLIVIVVLWRRDVKAAKEIYAILISEVKRERAELEVLRKNYMSLIPNGGIHKETSPEESIKGGN